MCCFYRGLDGLIIDSKTMSIQEKLDIRFSAVELSGAFQLDLMSACDVKTSDGFSEKNFVFAFYQKKAID